MTEASAGSPVLKSERRRAAEQSSAEEVTSGILRIMLPIDLPGLGHVNCYAIEDANGIALIDPGLADGVTHEVLSERLQDVGLDVADVHTAIATHSHFDHYGGIARLHTTNVGDPIHVCAHSTFGAGWHNAYDDLLIEEDEDSATLETRTDAEVIDYLDDMSQRLRRTSPWGPKTDGFPTDLLASMSVGIAPIGPLRPPTVTHAVDDGHRIELGGQSWDVVHTPGHCDDHICLWNGDLGVLFSGDHLLPHITPHISGFSAYGDPLAQFFASLGRLEDLGSSTVVLPAHGDPFADMSGRARAISEHHHGRLDRVREIGSEIGDQPVEEYMKLLFRERSWGMMAASETYAHLEWLRSKGEAKRTAANNRLNYRL